MIEAVGGGNFADRRLVGRRRQVLAITAAAGLLKAALLVAPGPNGGATGTAGACGISLTVMAIVSFVLGVRRARVVTRHGTAGSNQ